MYRLELTDAEEQTLEHTFKTTTDRRLRDRCQAVLMVARGRRRYEVARDLGVHRATLGKWLNSYREGGVEGLVIQWSPGKARRIGDELASRIIEWVKGGPVSCGLNRANWTYAELAHYLYQQTGIEVKETAMREFCHRHQIRPYRPSYRYLRADPEHQAQAKQELATMKKSPDGSVYFVESRRSTFSISTDTAHNIRGQRPSPDGRHLG